MNDTELTRTVHYSRYNRLCCTQATEARCPVSNQQQHKSRLFASKEIHCHFQKASCGRVWMLLSLEPYSIDAYRYAITSS